MKKFVLHQLIPGMLFLGMAVAAFPGRMDPLLGRLGTDRLRQQNETYLEETLARALTGFGVMSGLKAGLAVVEGSTGGVSAGISLHLQIGDVVQSAYDYVDLAWRTLLLGSICLLSIEYLLEVAELLDSVMLGICLFIFGVEMLWRKSPKPLRDAGLLFLFLSLVLYLLLPLSVWSASALSSRITRPGVDAAQQGFKDAGQDLFPEQSETKSENSGGMVARIREVPERLEQITVYLRNKTAQMSLWTVQLIAGYIFDCIVFPLGCFVLMIWGSRSLLRYCHSCSLHRELYRELRDLRIRK